MYLGNLFSVISDKLTIIFRQIKINEIILTRQPFCTDLHVCSFIYIIHNIECSCSSMFVGSLIKHHQISPYLGFQHLNFTKPLWFTDKNHCQALLRSIWVVGASMRNISTDQTTQTVEKNIFVLCSCSMQPLFIFLFILFNLFF